MSKPTTDADFADSVASTDYSQGFYDGFAEGSNKALAAAIAGDKLGIAFMALVSKAASLLEADKRQEYGDYVRSRVLPALDEWDKLRDQITEG